MVNDPIRFFKKEPTKTNKHGYLMFVQEFLLCSSAFRKCTFNPVESNKGTATAKSIKCRNT